MKSKSFIEGKREQGPNDPKLSDAEGLAQPVPGSVAAVPAVTGPERSLERMVRRLEWPLRAVLRENGVDADISFEQGERSFLTISSNKSYIRLQFFGTNEEPKVAISYAKCWKRNRILLGPPGAWKMIGSELVREPLGWSYAEVLARLIYLRGRWLAWAFSFYDHLRRIPWRHVRV